MNGTANRARTRSRLLAALALLALVSPVRAQEAPAADETLTGLCIRLNRVQESAIGEGELEAAVAALAASARDALVGASTPQEKVAALNRVLLADREVTYLSNKYWRDSTLAASLLRKKGNCLSTSTLYVVVGRELGLPIRAVLVPKHAFARWDDGTTAINIETTDRGSAVADEAYRSRSLYPEAEIRALGYGRSLTDAEFSAVLHQYAGRYLFVDDRDGEALAEIAEAKKLWPGNPRFEIDRLNVVYWKQGKAEEALRGYKALAESSASPEVRTEAAMAIVDHLQNRSDHDQALALLRQAYRVAPKYLHGRVLQSMASSYRTQRRFGEALVACELATLLEGEAEDFANLAVYYKNAGKLDGAIWALQQSLEKNPESWYTRLVLAGYMIRAGREAEGWKMFETVEKPDIDLLQWETNLAWFYGSVGKKAEFLEHLGEALDRSATASILDYIKTEVDFDKYRSDPDFLDLVAKHRERLLGGER